ncbi:MAG: DUF808 family protein [Bryobacterales bacterium]
MVSLLMTAMIYGLVAGLVKLDDLGLHLQRRGRGALATLGRWLIDGTPVLMRIVSFVGTVAMFLVGGGILMHGLHLSEQLEGWLHAQHVAGPLLHVVELLASGAMGAVAGGIAYALISGARWAWTRLRGQPAS